MRFPLKSLEYNVVWHCVNSCASCSHLSPINPRNDVDAKQFERSLSLAAELVEAEVFSILGGEPLLHPNLIELIGIAQESGISECVQVTTNGKLLDKQPEMFWDSIDALRVTRYPEQVTDEQWKRWQRKSEEHGIWFHGGMNPRFYKPVAAAEHSGPAAVARFDACPWRTHCTTLSDDRLYLCPQALFFPVHFPDLKDVTDSLLLDGATREDVESYFNRTTALSVCRRCSYSEYAPWKQVPKESWLKESMTNA